MKGEIKFNKDAEFLIWFYDRFYEQELASLKHGTKAESPIEKILAAAICIYTSGKNLFSQVPSGKDSFLIPACEMVSEDFGEITLNEPVLEFNKPKYRVDIAIRTSSGLKLAVECDGHDFHERTKEQAKRDKEKDRWLQSNGWFVARFTGSEIYNDPFEVVRKIDGIIYAHDQKVHEVKGREVEKQFAEYREGHF